jgi:hypothetical protein
MKIPKPIQERRRSIRIQESLPFKIGHEGYEIQATTLNIGYHGVMCALDTDMRLMTQLSIAITLPASGKIASKKITAKGVVVRKEINPETGKCYVAIFFSDIKPKDEAYLKEYIDRRLRD